MHIILVVIHVSSHCLLFIYATFFQVPPVPVNKCISGSVQKRLRGLKCHLWNSQSNIVPAGQCTAAADSPEIFLMRCAECHGVYSPFDLLKLPPTLPIIPYQKLWLLNSPSSPSCHAETLVLLVFRGQESNLGRWLCNRFSTCPGV